MIRRRHFIEALSAILIAAVLALMFTWPIAGRFSTAGRVDAADGRYSVWNIAWVSRALTTHPSELFNANIFHPHTGTLAYSEANVVAGVIAVPVWSLTSNVYAASNWVVLCTFVLAALAVYALVRRLTGDVAASAFAGISYAFSAYMYSHMASIQLLMTFGPPLALLAMHRLVDRPSVGRAACLGGAVAVMALACGYYGIMGGLAIAFGVTWFGVSSGRWRDWRYWALTIGAAAVAIVVVAPFFLPYLSIRAGGFSRSLDDSRMFSADWKAYLASGMLVHEWMLGLLGSWREVLFPGFVPIILAVYGAAAGRRRIVLFYLTIGGLAFWASLGPDAGLYSLLFRTVPFFSFLRAPGRFGLLVTLSVTVLSGIGLSMVLSRLSPRAGRWLGTGVVAAALVCSSAGPMRMIDAPAPGPVYTMLSTLPWGPVAEFPFFSEPDKRHLQTRYMLMSTYHWKPLLNGYSDFIPDDVRSDMPVLATFPSPEAWQILRTREARYVVVHWAWYYDPDERAAVTARMVAETSRLRLLVQTSDVSLYEVVGAPGASPHE